MSAAPSALTHTRENPSPLDAREEGQCEGGETVLGQFQAMKTNKFIAELGAALENRLLFVDRDGNSIHVGYHLTELKAVSLQTVDCGGQRNHWQEIIVQLWVPPQADDDYMTAAKFFSIFTQMRGMIPLQLTAQSLR